MNEKKEGKVVDLDDERDKAVKESGVIDITNLQLRDIVSYRSTEEDPLLNPYNRIMSSYEISPRLMNRCQYLATKIRMAVDNLEENRKKLLEKYCDRDDKGSPVMLPDENEVELRVVKHFSELAKMDENTNVTNSVTARDVEDVRKQILKNLPPLYWRYSFKDGEEVKFASDLNKLMEEKAMLDDVKKVSVSDKDLPDKFLNSYERSLLAPLFEFDDLEEIKE